ncbi:bifunctional 2-polyprenyl-6-hydroxyphenol methylase/3-demethylubiquinol 3-O-methyltransferase UbiG [Methylobacterium sp. NEAU K]|uniref:class I SAM-dependent methyltransferase n=1 Tax=Methylobacterium sp. NEAU K TaxID=3064946 RepID=UPI0027338FAE|nr:class I SAM-dependent methyltransferase [Methylobacterium sp. NEAU K]MDP4006088.1 class I SAM-dependent methyltransferase [Methylobacterium sp. NEAU K]
MDALTLIRDTFAPLPGKRILDIGCGPGTLAKRLAEDGAAVTGVDPGEAALAKARAAMPGARFEIASGEALPFPDASFDGAVLLNALHHVPDPAAALAEAARILVPGGVLVVVEPLAWGSFFDALQPIEDETAVRAAAQAAIAAALADGAFACRRDLTVERRESFVSLEAFAARVSVVDPAREETIRARRPVVEAAFLRAAERETDGRYALVQPLRIHVLEPV